MEGCRSKQRRYRARFPRRRRQSMDDQDLSLRRRCQPYSVARYFGIGEKNIIKFNGPSGRGISRPRKG